MKGVLAGVAFLFSVGAVSTKLLGSRYTDFCFCSPPLAQPAFTAPDDEHKDAAIIGGALPARVVAQRAPIQVEAFNVEAHHDAAIAAGSGFQGRALSHLGVLWGTDGHNGHGGWSGNGSFVGHGGGMVGAGMIAGGGRHANATGSSSANKPSSTPKSSTSRPSAPPVAAPPAVTAPSAGVILPPAGGGFAFNCAPVPGFGTGSTGASGGTTGVTLGGIPIGGRGGKSLSVTPEPAPLLLTLTGLFLAFAFLRRERTQA